MKKLIYSPITRIIFLTGLILIMSIGLKPVATFAAVVTNDCYSGGPSDPSPNNVANGQCSCPPAGCLGIPVTSACYNGLATNTDKNNSKNNFCRCPATGCEGSNGGFNSANTNEFINRRADGNNDPASNCNPGQEGCNIDQFIEKLINAFSGLVGVVVVLSIVIGGIQYASAGDEPGKLQAARQRITKALIALLAFIFLYALLQYIVPGGVLG